LVSIEDVPADVTVALSGDGADELFGGYNTYIADRYARGLRLLPAAFEVWPQAARGCCRYRMKKSASIIRSRGCFRLPARSGRGPSLLERHIFRAPNHALCCFISNGAGGLPAPDRARASEI
jgi:asparagine synthetase B (glutamine-hydrolysing)